jgi:hypothetical protein
MRKPKSKNRIPKEHKEANRYDCFMFMHETKDDLELALKLLEDRYPDWQPTRPREYVLSWYQKYKDRTGKVGDAPRSGRPNLVSDDQAKRAAKAFTQKVGLSRYRSGYADVYEVIISR